MPEINGIQVPFIPIGSNKELKHTPARVVGGNNLVDFKQIFQEELRKVKFSGHAQTRLISREIELDPQQILRLENAIDKAESKNCKDSLIMLDETAMIVNIPNRTVITVFDKSGLTENIITNIDSALFA